MKSAPRKKVHAGMRPLAGRLRQLFRANVFDKEAWEKIVAVDLHVRIGNAPATIGRDAALGRLEQFLSRVESLGAGFCAVWQRQDALFAETEVQFTDAAQRPQSIPCTIVGRVAHGNLCDLRIHLDPSAIP